jgi:arylsulfatase A-like enzyme
VRRLALVLLLLACAPPERRPSILLIVTDDQGYGDLGANGNRDIRTPHLDNLALNSCRIDPFCVSPVCSPTRSSLLTGRYNYRTGIVDTFMGRSMMHPDEVTIAEILGQAGYRTGIFGKWHLGDNYPLRPQDQGFQDCLTIRGGGIGQPSDPPGGDHYTDATMYRNGAAFKSKGYCTDVFTDGALKFVEANAEKPFFAYVAYNAPHTPLEVPEGYLQPYLDAKLPEQTARLYAMVTNIDDNVGRLLKKLDDLKIADDTIVIFMSDNGPEKARYNAGLRGLKGTVYDGGLRVPFFFRWPSALKASRTVQSTFAHIDVTPTLLEATGVAAPAGVRMDGMSFLPWLRENLRAPERVLFFQWHRGDVPQRMRSAAARGSRYKAVWKTPEAAPELFDLDNDLAEANNVAAAQPAVLRDLTKAYTDWFDAMERTRGFAPPRIVLGTDHEDPAVLTRQDWRGEKASWTPTGNGHWLVRVDHDVLFDVTLRFRAPGARIKVTYTGGVMPVEATLEPDATSITLPAVLHAAGDGQISATLGTDKPYGPNYVELKRTTR